jgi:hypothetical protein
LIVAIDLKSRILDFDSAVADYIQTDVVLKSGVDIEESEFAVEEPE